MKISNPRISFYLLMAILVTAAILRFNQINQPFIDMFSWRQSSTAMMAENLYRRNWNIFYPEVNWTGPGPNYQGRELQTVTFISALFYLIVGQQDWVGRSVAVIFGLWGIFALYQVVRLVWGEKYALASAAVMALLPGSIFVERSFLPDPAMVALVTSSVWMLLIYCKTERSRFLLLATVIGTWGFLTKLPGLIIGIPMLYAMFTILGRKTILKAKKLFLISFAAFFSLSCVIAYYLWARHLSLSYPPYHFAGSGNWLWDSGLQNWWNEKYFLPQLYQLFNSWIWTKPIIALVLLGLVLSSWQWIAIFRVKQPLRNEFQAKLLFHWWILAVAIYYLIGAKELVSNPWNFHLINPAAAAFAGYGIIEIASFSNRVARSTFPKVSFAFLLPVVTVALIFLIVGGFGQRNLQWMYYPYAQDSYQLGLALGKISQPQELVITLAKQLGDPSAIYYSRRRGWVFPPAEPGKAWGELPEDDQEAIRLLEQLRGQGADWLGLVKQHRNNIWTNHPLLAKHIEQIAELKQEDINWSIYQLLPGEEPG